MKPVTIDQIVAFRPEPGDVVVVMLVERPTLEQAHWLREELKDALPDSVKVFVAVGCSGVELVKRWASFSDDEMTTLQRCLRAGSPHGLLVDEIKAEMDRRAS